MSVTIHSSPQIITPSDNPIKWEFSSNQTGQPNFSYIVEAYVNGVLDSRHEIFPEVGARAHFDMVQIMRKMTPVATPGHTTVVKSAGNTATCYLTVRERYGATPAYQASATTATVTCYKSALNKVDFAAYTAADYMIGSTDGRFMTTSPNTLRIQPAKDNIVTIWNPVPGETNIAIVFQLFGADGSSIPGAEVVIDNAIAMIQLNLRVDLLVDETIIPQSFFDAADYMEYFIEQDGGIPVSETKRIYFDHTTCGTPTHFVWLNRFGSFDCFNFAHNRIYSSSIESRTYEKQFGEWQGASFVYDPNNSGVIDYLKRTKGRMTAVSGFIYEDQQKFLVSSMYESPLCFLKEDDFVRVKIEATAYELQDDDFEEEFSEEVEISFPNINESQLL